METCCYKSNIAANSFEKKKKMVLLMMMMLQDEEASSKIVSRKVWARKWLLRRPEKRVFYTLFKEVALEDLGGFWEFMRMPYEKCCELAEVFSESITKQIFLGPIVDCIYCFLWLALLAFRYVLWYRTIVNIFPHVEDTWDSQVINHQ